MNPSWPTASRLGVLSGRIVGLDDDLDGITADVTEDLDGATVVPGFYDAHCHTAWFGLSLAGVDAAAVDSLDELYAAVRVKAVSLADDPSAWVEGSGFNRFGGAYPDIRQLDEASLGHRALPAPRVGPRLHRQ